MAPGSLAHCSPLSLPAHFFVLKVASFGRPNPLCSFTPSLLHSPLSCVFVRPQFSPVPLAAPGLLVSSLTGLLLLARARLPQPFDGSYAHLPQAVPAGPRRWFCSAPTRAVRRSSVEHGCGVATPPVPVMAPTSAGGTRRLRGCAPSVDAANTPDVALGLVQSVPFSIAASAAGTAELFPDDSALP